MLNCLTDAVSMFDHDWRWTYINPAARAVLVGLGVDPDSVIGRVLWEVLPQLAGTLFETETRRALATNTLVTYEEYMPVLDRWLENRIVPSAHGVTSFTRDITEQRRAAEILRSGDAEYLALANSIPTLAWMANPDGWIFWYNDRWYEYTGTTPEEMQGWKWQSVHDPEMLPRVMEEWTRSIHTGQPFEMTFPLRGADGRFRPFLTRVSPVLDAAGRVTRWFGTNTDVEVERRAQDIAVQAAIRIERLQSLTAALAAAVTVEDVADVVVSDAAMSIGATTAALFKLIGDHTEAETVLQSGLNGNIRDRYRRFPLTAPGPGARCMRTGLPIFIESRTGDNGLWAQFPDALDIWETLDTHAVATVPLSVAGNLVGSVSFTFNAPREFTQQDREFFLAVGGQAAQALERARLLTAEREAREAAESANRVKAEFLAAMSHELRTPLNAIGGYAQLLDMGIHGAVTVQQQEAIARIQRSQRHLLSLINDLLNFTRLEAGRVEYNIANVSIRQALDTLETLVSFQLSAKHLRFTREEHPECGMVRADPDKLQQVLVNLMSNAIKFSPEGGAVRIVGELVDDRVVIAVQDTGIGIARDRIEQVFAPFVQIDRRLNTPNDGVGLGLAISRDLARGMGGDLTAESEPGEGSKFLLTLPAP